jgi:hypothetical protein
MVRRIFLAKADLADWLNGAASLFCPGRHFRKEQRQRQKISFCADAGGEAAKPSQCALQPKLTMTTPRQGAYIHSFHCF